jgi:N-acetylmuramoyl-L-alanine amidase
VTIELENMVPYEVRRLAHRNRLSIDLPRVRLAPDWGRLDLQVNDGRLAGIHILTQTQADSLRVTLDLQQSDWHIFTLPNPYRIVIDFFHSHESLSPALPERQSAPAPVTPPAVSKTPSPRRTPTRPGAEHRGVPAESRTERSRAKTQPVLPRPHSRAPAPTIVIDPGHGGHDPGAIGPGGVAEKTVVLRIAKELRQFILASFPQARVLLTREQDVFVPLKRRTEIANAAQAQLFLSIHANSSPQPQARGVETWYLSFAANERAKKIATRENRTAAAKLPELETILRDLHETDRIQASATLAEKTQAALVKHLGRQYEGIINRGIDGAPFVVLLHTAMPSILVEVAFISNPHDAERLQTATYQKALAQGIFSGVRQYLHTTVFAAQ